MRQDKFSVFKPFKSDGCSWFPDLWIKPCCKDHDYGVWAGHDEHENDTRFLACIAERSKRLGAFSFVFAGGIVTGMALGRPIFELYKRIRHGRDN